MSNRDLLKEAIADAKAVKEMAISNAKAALEEAFTPQLKSMLEKKLTEMDEEDDKEMEEAKMHDEEKMEEKMHDDETMTEEELNELLAELEEGDEEEVHEEEKEEMHEEEEEPEADEEEKEEEEFDLEEMSEEDLKAFIEDVVDEMIEAGELEAGEEEMEAPEMEASEEEVTDEESEEETEEEPMMESKKPAEELEEMIAITPAVVLTILGGIVSLMGGAVAKAYFSFKKEEKEETAKRTAEKIKQGMNPEQAAAEATKEVDKMQSIQPVDSKYTTSRAGATGAMNLEEDEKEGMEEIIDPTGSDFQALADALNVTMETAKYITVAFGLSVPVLIGMIHAGGTKAIDFIKKTYKKLTGKQAADSDEVTETIETLKAELNEVNLLNSKLLYTNKIFKAKNLTEAQKVKVLTTFDKAESVKEVKLVYETLLEGLVSTTSNTKEAIKESKSFASKAVGTSPKKPVVETDGMVSRFQKLAGIK